jgi:hypothetical protein
MTKHSLECSVVCYYARAQAAWRAFDRLSKRGVDFPQRAGSDLSSVGLISLNSPEDPGEGFGAHRCAQDVSPAVLTDGKAQASMELQIKVMRLNAFSICQHRRYHGAQSVSGLDSDVVLRKSEGYLADNLLRCTRSPVVATRIRTHGFSYASRVASSKPCHGRQIPTFFH